MSTKDKFIKRCNEIGVKYINHREKEGGKYKNWIITYECEKHGILETTWESLRKIKRCKKCSVELQTIRRKVDFETVKREFENRGYVLIEEQYINSVTPMRYICPKHPDKELYTTLNSLRSGHGCRFCYYERQRKYTKEDVINKLNENNLKLINFFEKDGVKYVKYYCIKHPDLEQETTIYNIINGQQCTRCKYDNLSKKFRLDFNEVKNTFQNKGFILLEKEYINNSVPMKFICIKHKELGIQESTYTTVKYNSGCRGCAKEKYKQINLKDNETFLREVKEQVGDEYTFLEEYQKSDVKIKVKHNKCGHVYKVSPALFLRGRRCPKCKRSNGEKRIADFLDKNNIAYIPEYKIKECRNIFPLPFDFAVFKDNYLFCLIEYQGEHHYIPKDYYGGYEEFIKRKHNDKIKKDYCKKNNIDLIEIPYWEYENIENILNERIVKHYHDSVGRSNFAY